VKGRWLEPPVLSRKDLKFCNCCFHGSRLPLMAIVLCSAVICAHYYTPPSLKIDDFDKQTSLTGLSVFTCFQETSEFIITYESQVENFRLGTNQIIVDSNDYVFSNINKYQQISTNLSRRLEFCAPCSECPLCS